MQGHETDQIDHTFKEMNNRSFAELVVRSGYITMNQLNDCLREQRDLLKSGACAHLSEIMRDRGLIDEAQEQELRRTSGRRSAGREENTYPNEIMKKRSPSVWPAGGSGSKSPASPEISAFQTIGEFRIRTGEIAWPDASGDGSADFKLDVMIGKGGMGRVFTARQISLDRTVAVKLIQPDSENPALRGKFISEAIVTGNLDHPNIVPVHELRCASDGSPFYAMKLVRGVSWSKVIRDKSEQDNLEILLRVCDAAAYAHDKGVVHRDLKPDNVMLGNYGEVMVMDWGLSVSIDDRGKAERLTEKTSLAGTPTYMPPEIARNVKDRVGPCSDIYMLGGILYEIVTGLKPHSGKDTRDCILAAMRNDIQPADKTGELIDIARRALSSEIENRYATVKEFQGAIREYLSHRQSILLTETAANDFSKALSDKGYDRYALSLFGYREALKLWPGNTEAARGLSDVTLAFAEWAYEKGNYDLASTLIDSDVNNLVKTKSNFDQSRLNAYIDFSDNLERAKQRRKDRKQTVKRLITSLVALNILIMCVLTWFLIVNRQRLENVSRAANVLTAQDYYKTIRLAEMLIEDKMFEPAKRFLTEIPEKLRKFEWGVLMRECTSDLITLKGHTGPVSAAVFSSGGRMAATGSDTGEVMVWNAETGKKIFDMQGFTGKAAFLRFSGNDTEIIAGNGDSAYMKWDLTTGRTPKPTVVERDSHQAAQRDSQGKRRIFFGFGKTATIRETESGEKISVLVGHDSTVTCAELSNNGNKAVTGTSKGVVRIWDSDTGRLIRRLAGHAGEIRCAAFSPNNRRIITGSLDGAARIWDAPIDLSRTVLTGHYGPVIKTVFSPDGALVATTSQDDEIIIWDSRNGRKINTIRNKQSRVNDIAFSPGGRRIAAGYRDHSGVVYDVASGEQEMTLEGHSDSVMSIRFSRPGSKILTGSRDMTAAVWNAQTGERERLLKCDSPVLCADFSPGGELISTGEFNGKAILWDAETGVSRRVFKGHQGAVICLDFSSNGGKLVTGGQDRTAVIWDVYTGNMGQTLSGHRKSVTSVVFSPAAGGRRLAVASRDGAVKIYDSLDGKEYLTLTPKAGPLYSLDFSPDGERLVAGAGDRIAVIWNTLF